MVANNKQRRSNVGAKTKGKIPSTKKAITQKNKTTAKSKQRVVQNHQSDSNNKNAWGEVIIRIIVLCVALFAFLALLRYALEYWFNIYIESDAFYTSFWIGFGLSALWTIIKHIFD